MYVLVCNYWELHLDAHKFLHTGSDLNASSVCCPNTQYCIVNESSLAIQCCSLGSTCGGTCDEDSFYSLVTTTAVTNAASTSMVNVETFAACLSRKCTGTHYLCPDIFGGNCCTFGSDCGLGGVCLSPLEETPGSIDTGTTTPSATATDTGMLPTSTAAGASAIRNDNPLKIGLEVGIPVAIIGFSVLAFVWHIQRARKRGNASKDGEQEKYRKPELAASEHIPPVGLKTPIFELPAQILEAELPEQGIVAELPLEAAFDTGEQFLSS